MAQISDATYEAISGQPGLTVRHYAEMLNCATSTVNKLLYTERFRPLVEADAVAVGRQGARPGWALSSTPTYQGDVPTTKALTVVSLKSTGITRVDQKRFSAADTLDTFVNRMSLKPSSRQKLRDDIISGLDMGELVGLQSELIELQRQRIGDLEEKDRLKDQLNRKQLRAQPSAADDNTARRIVGIADGYADD